MDRSQIGRGGATQALAAMLSAARAGNGPFGAVLASRGYVPKGTDPGNPPPDSTVAPFTPPGRVLEEIANPTAGNALTPNIIRGSGARASDLNLYQLTSAVWVPVTIDRPEIWIPQGFIGAPIWYSPNTIPKVASSTGDTQKSTRFGVVYLPSPGTWWLQYTVSPARTITMLRIDAFQPGVVSRYLGEAGCHNGTSYVAATTLLAPTVVLPNNGSVVTILAENRDRTGLTIQNNSTQGAGGTNGTVLITHSSDLTLAATNPIANGNLGGPRGIALPVGATITFSGDTNVKGNIRACSQSTTGMMANLQLDMIEYV